MWSLKVRCSKRAEMRGREASSSSRQSTTRPEKVESSKVRELWKNLPTRALGRTATMFLDFFSASVLLTR